MNLPDDTTHRHPFFQIDDEPAVPDDPRERPDEEESDEKVS